MSAIEDIFARVGCAAICLSSAEGDLLAVEQRIGCKLPAAFREFYSVEDARALLKYYSNSDRPLSVADSPSQCRRAGTIKILWAIKSFRS
jgi:hypothetical protein